jgi:adenine-specific DNA-methyltransferase
VLKIHLSKYVAKNSMDYFIHKDLQAFLEGELEFFLQNEVLDVDELIKSDDVSSPPVLRARTVREIAERIISFLAQIEDFQKRLFEKKKFVVQTDYMITLDQVPDDLYGEILENDEQLEQWQDVYNTDQWDTDLKWQGEFDQTFLNNHPYVMIDTALFDDEFKLKLLSAFEDVDETVDGVLVNGENFQAMNLFSGKYMKSVDCTFIDPPYNTGGRGFLFKDNYQHSSWLSMMTDRLSLCKGLISDEGIFFATIDDTEKSNLIQLCDSVFGSSNFIADIAWEKRYTRSNNAKLFSTVKDGLLCYRMSDKLTLLREPRTEDSDSIYSNPDNDPRGDWTSVLYVNPASKEDRPNLVYSIENPITGEKVTHPTNAWKYSPETHKEHVEEDRLYWGENGDYEYPRLKRFLSEVGGLVPVDIWEYENTGTTHQASIALGDLFGEKVFDNPKPVRLIKRIGEIRYNGNVLNSGLFLDFFAGSGTTGHAIMNLNQEDDGNRKYLLVEMGEYFDSVLRPRIQKVAFANEWSKGIPENQEGQSQFVRYHRIESYEDSLNNIQLTNAVESQQVLSIGKIDDYMESYMLDIESSQSDSLLPESTFEEPFNFKLKIEGNGSSREPTTVDLVETFHYLIGADVLQYWHKTHQNRKYVVTECEIDTESGVETVLTAWRPTEDIDYDEEREWFDDEFDTESYDRVYVNGESQIAQSEPLEITFREKMEESPNVA